MYRGVQRSIALYAQLHRAIHQQQECRKLLYPPCIVLQSQTEQNSFRARWCFSDIAPRQKNVLPNREGYQCETRQRKLGTAGSQVVRNGVTPRSEMMNRNDLEVLFFRKRARIESPENSVNYNTGARFCKAHMVYARVDSARL